MVQPCESLWAEARSVHHLRESQFPRWCIARKRCRSHATQDRIVLVVETFRLLGVPLAVVDLYRAEFDPLVLVASDRSRPDRSSLHPVLVSGVTALVTGEDVPHCPSSRIERN